MGNDAAPESLLTLTSASECSLLEWIQSQANSLMFEEIATNDWGKNTAEHLAGILAQLAPHPPLGLLPWCPREVLELERWSEPDLGRQDTPPSGRRGHLKRLLACTILLKKRSLR